MSGDLSSQYDIYVTNDVSGNITRKSLTAYATARDKYYDGLTDADASVSITTGIIPGDNIDILSFNANFDTPEIGDNKTVNITDIQLGGSSGNNYVGLPATTTASIVYNPYITAFNPRTYTSPGPSYQTTTNTSSAIRYGGYVNRNS